MYQITGQMYLSRDREKVLFIDELEAATPVTSGSDDPVKAAVVEEAARRARVGGAFRHRDPERRRLPARPRWRPR